MTTANKINEFTLSNNCECEWDCACDCFSQSLEFFDDFIDGWTASQPQDTVAYLVEGANMGWRHDCGVKIVDLPSEIMPWHEVFDASRCDEWVQRYFIEGDTLTVSQSHHDAPCGETYYVTPITLDMLQPMASVIDKDREFDVLDADTAIDFIDYYYYSVIEELFKAMR